MNNSKTKPLLYILPLVLLLTACEYCGQQRIAAAISDAGRTEQDRQRDLESKPAEILKLLNLGEGAQVADLFAGGGYYSELLGHIVGEKGKVIAHTVEIYHKILGDALEKRFKDRMPQVHVYAAEPNDIELGSETLDAAIMIMSYHDLYLSKPEAPTDASKFIDKIYFALKPGGKLLIEDHQARPGAGNSDSGTLHRIEEGFAMNDLENHGFKLVATSQVLRSAEDDHSKNVFDPAIRGKTDRFVLLFEKPKK
ncbi:MAG TPA: hypothetical protein VFX02_13790 [Gammaproteobacteria bacterium]|nr:hypothetical protein [Gammaproteobacteria bacterium]